MNDDDIGSQVPPGFVHVGKLFHFGADGSVGNESVEAVSGDSSEKILTDAKFAQLKLSLQEEKLSQNTEGIGLEGWFPSFSGHSLDRYLEKILTQLP